MLKKTMAPKQERSRESLRRLIAAARAVLNEKGLDGATVPRVAARAGLSPASVYRRFPDKDAMMRSVVLETLQNYDEGNEAVLTPKLAKLGSLATFAEKIVEQSLIGHRKNAGMLRAMTQFILSHPSTAFKKKAAQISFRSLNRVADFLLRKRKEINHPRPEEAVPFALTVVGFVLQEIVVLDALPEVQDPRLPKNDADLVRELTRVLLSYLGVSSKGEPA
jgi:AcrR family transcriptional regulator